MYPHDWHEKLDQRLEGFYANLQLISISRSLSLLRQGFELELASVIKSTNSFTPGGARSSENVMDLRNKVFHVSLSANEIIINSEMKMGDLHGDWCTALEGFLSSMRPHTLTRRLRLACDENRDEIYGISMRSRMFTLSALKEKWERQLTL